MKVIYAKDYEELSRLTANIIISVINLTPNPVLGLATGSTPIGTYSALVDANKRGFVDFSETTTFNLDEYCGLNPSHEQSYRYFMNSHLLNHINIHKDNTFVPDGLAADMKQQARLYESLIEARGGIDLQLLGIGPNGHIGFNEPDTVFHKETHTVELTQSTIEANSRFFGSSELVPKQAVTMGMGTIMAAKRIVFISTGKAKEKITKRALFGEVTPEVPASLLQYHPNVTAICCFN